MNDGFKFPTVEVFGPTIQGEGMDQGTPCYFVRIGGCDYRCEWCDSPHAVLPHAVRSAPRFTAMEIVEKIQTLPPGPRWVILSGGNPALFKLGSLVALLNLNGYNVALETQGTKWKDWIARCQRVAVSPKPPSAKQVFDAGELHNFMRNLNPAIAFLKVVVFDQLDYDFSKVIHGMFPRFPMFLSAGNDAGATVGQPDRVDERSNEQIARDLVTRGRWLANRVMVDEIMHDVRVQMQQHVLWWGNERGR